MKENSPGRAPVVTFTADFHQFSRGDPRASDRCLLRYDPLRIVPRDDGYRHGDPARPVTAYVRALPGGKLEARPMWSPSGVLATAVEDPGGDGSVVITEVSLPPGSDELECWFGYVDRTGSERWDSRSGANYHLRFPRFDIELRAARVVPDGAKSRLKVEIAARSVVDAVTIRYRVVNDQLPRREGRMIRRADSGGGAPAGARSSDDRVTWASANLDVPFGASVAFDLVYVVRGHEHTDDHDGAWYVAT